jgi:hypothetical protein
MIISFSGRALLHGVSNSSVYVPYLPKLADILQPSKHISVITVESNVFSLGGVMFNIFSNLVLVGKSK